MSGLASACEVAGEEQADRRIDRSGEPAVPETHDADAEVAAVAGHGGDDRAFTDGVAGIMTHLQ